MSYIDDNLGTGERVSYRTSYHWVKVATPCAIYIFFGIVSLLIGVKEKETTFFALTLLCALGIVSSVLDFMFSEFAVTNQRVIAKFGVISRRTIDINIHKIEGINVSQNIFGSICGFGKLVVKGTGGDKEYVSYIPKPGEFRKAATSAISTRAGM